MGRGRSRVRGAAHDELRIRLLAGILLGLGLGQVLTDLATGESFCRVDRRAREVRAFDNAAT